MLRLPPHVNPGLEIVLLDRGVLEWQVDGKPETVSPGCVFFTLPWQRHGSVREFEPGHLWHFVILRVEANDLSRERPFRFPRQLGLREAENREIASLLGACERHSWPAGTLLAQAVRELVVAHEANPTANDLAKRGLILVVLAELARVIRTHVPHPRDAAEWRMQRVVAEMERRAGEDWNLAKMTQLAGLRKSHFLEAFRRETGDSPRMFLNRKRVEIARADLVGTRRTITEIAHDCGFASSQRFATVFKRLTGMTPTEYRGRQAPRR